MPCTGAVLHTLNIRLFEEQLIYIVNHAEDRVIFVDDSLVPVLEKLAPELAGVEHYVVMGDGDGGRAPQRDALRGAARAGGRRSRSTTPSSTSARPRRSATRAARPGNPKGVLYSHRSISLHSTATLMTDANGLSRADRVLAVVPMFHANAWGLPYGAALAGADLVLPDRFLDAEPLAKLIAQRARRR